MTAQERAAEVYEGLAGRDLDCPADVEAIASAIRAAVLAERESCATLAQEFERPPAAEDPRGRKRPSLQEDIAEAIRGMGD